MKIIQFDVTEDGVIGLAEDGKLYKYEAIEFVEKRDNAGKLVSRIASKYAWKLWIDNIFSI